MRDSLEASGTQIVTVALRRADLSGEKDPYANILEFIDPKKYLLLPNTSGAMNAEEAVRLARLAASAGLPMWVKLEIHPDPTYLLPDPIETLKAAEILVKEGFVVRNLLQNYIEDSASDNWATLILWENPDFTAEKINT